MKKTLIILAFVTTMGLAVSGADCPDQSDFPWITCQPVNQMVPVNSNATFSVEATNGPLTYQWLSNGVALAGQTNSSFTVANAQFSDVAFYSCNIGKELEIVPTRAASLFVYTNTVDAKTGIDPIVVFGPPAPNGGAQPNCPGSYAGYINYTKTIAQGWGWAPDTNTTTVFTAADGGGRTDTRVTYTGKSADYGCNQTIVTVPNPSFSVKYRFTIFFPTNVPSTNYPITLDGFLP